jgi:hypothetical protein
MREIINRIRQTSATENIQVEGIIHDDQIGVTSESGKNAGLYDLMLINNLEQLIDIQLESSELKRILLFKDWLRDTRYVIDPISNELEEIDYKSTLVETIFSFYSSILLSDDPRSAEGLVIRKKVDKQRDARKLIESARIRKYEREAKSANLETVLNQDFNLEFRQEQQCSVEFENLEQNTIEAGEDYFKYYQEIFYVLFCRLPNESEENVLNDKNNKYRLVMAFRNLNQETLLKGENLWHEFYREKGRNLKNSPDYLDLSNLHFSLNLSEKYLGNMNQVYERIYIPENDINFLKLIDPLLKKLQLEKSVNPDKSYSDIFYTYKEKVRGNISEAFDENHPVNLIASYLTEVFSRNIDADLLRINTPNNSILLNEYALLKLISESNNQPFISVSDFFNQAATPISEV